MCLFVGGGCIGCGFYILIEEKRRRYPRQRRQLGDSSYLSIFDSAVFQKSSGLGCRGCSDHVNAVQSVTKNEDDVEGPYRTLLAVKACFLRYKAQSIF